jgi:hypothetical protein
VERRVPCKGLVGLQRASRRPGTLAIVGRGHEKQLLPGTDLGTCCSLWPLRDPTSVLGRCVAWLFDGELMLVLDVEPGRLSKLVCVVERTGDVVAIERALLGRLVDA